MVEQQMRYCSNCGKQHEKVADRCPNCGNQIEKNERVYPHCRKKKFNIWNILFTVSSTITAISLLCYLSFDYGNQLGVKRSTPLYQIGDIGPAGGWIFYDKGSFSDGWRYLEAAPANTEFTAEWCSLNLDIPGTDTKIGTGKQNTELIIQTQNNARLSSMAAQRCVLLVVNGYSDWFLPSKDELALMYIFLYNNNGIGNFNEVINEDVWSDWFYWSSSQSGSYGAWYQNFEDGSQYLNLGNLTLRVRAVRAF